MLANDSFRRGDFTILVLKDYSKRPVANPQNLHGYCPAWEFLCNVNIGSTSGVRQTTLSQVH